MRRMNDRVYPSSRRVLHHVFGSRKLKEKEKRFWLTRRRVLCAVLQIVNLPIGGDRFRNYEFVFSLGTICHINCVLSGVGTGVDLPVVLLVCSTFPLFVPYSCPDPSKCPPLPKALISMWEWFLSAVTQRYQSLPDYKLNCHWSSPTTVFVNC